MARIDAFSAEIVRLVRNMSDEAILALVRNQLNNVTGANDVTFRGSKRRSESSRTETQSDRTSTKRPLIEGEARRGPGAREALLAAVERAIVASNGLSASEIAKNANIDQARVASAIKELKAQKRVFQGGDRRFARYAADPKTAQQASDLARETASGPIVKRAGKKAT